MQGSDFFMPKYKAYGYYRLSYTTDHTVESDSIANQELLYRGWFHHLLYKTAVHLWQNGMLQL